MKYYAVTEDPNELLHYGVKGMKWGQHLFGDDLRPKSRAYKSAAKKLMSISSKKASNVKKTATQKLIDFNRFQQNKYNRAVAKSQKRFALMEQQNIIDALKNNDNNATREAKRAKKIAQQQAKIEKYKSASQVNMARQEVKAAKNAYKVDKKFDKVLQEAREGRLRFGKLSDDQIARVQERLASEENARRLGGKEEKSWRMQKREARRKGKLQGIERGTAASMEEVARAATLFGIKGIKNRMMLNSKAKSEGKRERIKSSQKNKKTHRDINREIKEEAYEAKAREGQNIFQRNKLYSIDDSGGFHFERGSTSNARYLKRVAEQKKLEEAAKNERDKDRQLNDQIFKALAMKTTNIDDIDDIRKKIYGEKEVTKIDQPSSNRSSLVKRAGKNVIKNASRAWNIVDTNLLYGGSGEEALYERLAEEKRKRDKYNNPLKG